jgi:hypothetical protein
MTSLECCGGEANVRAVLAYVLDHFTGFSRPCLVWTSDARRAVAEDAGRPEGRGLAELFDGLQVEKSVHCSSLENARIERISPNVIPNGVGEAHRRFGTQERSAAPWRLARAASAIFQSAQEARGCVAQEGHESCAGFQLGASRRLGWAGRTGLFRCLLSLILSLEVRHEEERFRRIAARPRRDPPLCQGR